MDLPSQTHQEQLPRICKQVKESYSYFSDNYKRFNKFQKFLWQTNWTDSERATLNDMGKPDDEFNVLQAYIDRLIGEFSKQEPSAEVHSEEYDAVELQIIELMTAHLQAYCNNEEVNKEKKAIYKDMLAGGFSVAKVYTDYLSRDSMQQEIKMERVFDPTLCYFDPMARKSHKGDGNYCGEFFPLSEDEFKSKYPGVSIETMSYGQMEDGFNWSYQQGNQKIIILVDHYEKKKRYYKICQVMLDGKPQTMKYADYKRMVKEIEENPNDLRVTPQLIGKPRETCKEEVIRYRLIKDKLLEREVTDFTMLPLVFFDGNSVVLKKQDGGETYQFCKPYIYHALDAQRFKNFCGSAWANNIENQVQHKWMMAKEAIPKEPELKRGLLNNQIPNIVIYNSVHENNPEMPIMNPIQPVQQQPAPPEIMQGFQAADSLMQMILGSYDSSLGINDNQLSGVAVIEAATQANAVGMPYIDGFLDGLQRCLHIYVDMFPKYNVTPRTIPVKGPDGKAAYAQINQPNQKPFKYSEGVLNVKVRAGASAAIQQSKALKVVEGLMSVSPMIAQFFSMEGLPFLLENIECKGIEQLRAQIPQFVQKMQKQEAQAKQQGAQQNPAVMKLQLDAQKMKQEGVLDQQKLQLEQEKMQNEHTIDLLTLEADRAKLHAELHMSANKDAMDIKRAEIDHSHHLDDHALDLVKHVDDVIDKTEKRKTDSKNSKKPAKKDKKK